VRQRRKRDGLTALQELTLEDVSVTREHVHPWMPRIWRMLSICPTGDAESAGAAGHGRS
jgi:hypothetical protein